MIIFPNAKINIGLSIKNKRADGFHNIETVFYPIDLYDVLEFKESDNQNFKLWNNKLDLSKDNSILKAYNLIKKEYKIPEFEIHLLKNIPDKAGLGGGSADASFFIKAINNYFNLKLSKKKIENITLKIGSDCPFFIRNKAVYASSRGEIFKNINLNLSEYYIVIVKPNNISIDTKSAYDNIIRFKENNINSIENIAIDLWKYNIYNDFENYAFKEYPQLKQIKDTLYNTGAIFALMTGSGSAIYGIFDKLPEKTTFKDCFIWNGRFIK